MASIAKTPTPAELAAVLGTAEVVWAGIIDAVQSRSAPLNLEWKPSKSDFGRICLLQHRKRTLVYLTPEKNGVKVAIILGERAYEILKTSDVPMKIKKLFAEARPYAEGRGIRYSVSSVGDIPVVARLVDIKTTPK